MKQLVDPKTIDNMLVDVALELGRIRRVRAGMMNAKKYGADFDAATVKGIALNQAVESLADLQSAYGWTQYILVPDGHIHVASGCVTLRHDTIRTFLPDESGNSVDEMIAKYTTAMCTVCFPDAPVDPAYQEAVRKTEADKQAARVAKAAEKQAKLDATPKGDDGEPLEVGYDTPQTLRGARNALTRRFKDIYWYLETHKHNGTQPSASSIAADAEVLAECNVIARSIARMTGETAADVYEASRIKAEKSAKAEFAKALRDRR